MKKYLFIIPAFIFSVNSFCQSFKLLSPDKTIKVFIQTTSQLTYSIFTDDVQIIDASPIDMQLSNNISLSKALNIKSTKTKSISETIVAQIPVSRKSIPNIYNELTIQFKNNFAVIFRVYNDGIAYRIATSFKDSITVINETAQFNFENTTTAYAPVVTKRPDQDVFHTSFEELYQHRSLDSFSANDYMFTPVLTSTANDIKVAVTESDLDDYPGMFLRGTSSNSFQSAFAAYPLEERIAEGDYPEMIVSKRADYIAKTSGTRNFPWRVLLIAREDKELPANDLVYRLATPTQVEDASWIHPGKCTDEWIIDINLFNMPFKSGINTATYKYYIDFAKRFGFDRIMMDAGWSNTRDLFDINPNLNMDTLAAYSKQKGIKLSMWTLNFRNGAWILS